MAKYKIYKNKKLRYHPSIQIEEDLKNKEWKNLSITHKPNRSGFELLPDNLNPNDNSKSYISKKIKIQPLRERGKEIKKYKITESNLVVIEKIIDKNKKIGVSQLSDSPIKRIGQSPTKNKLNQKRKDL